MYSSGFREICVRIVLTARAIAGDRSKIIQESVEESMRTVRDTCHEEITELIWIPI